MTAKTIRYTGSRSRQSDSTPQDSDSTPQDEELSDLVWDAEIQEDPTFLMRSPELVFLAFKDGHLNRDEWSECVRTAVHSPGSSEQHAIKEQLMVLYLSSAGGKSLSKNECENFAEAWIQAAAARAAFAEGRGDAAKAHLDSAYGLLTRNIKSQARRRLSERKAKGRKECREAFAKLAKASRPVGGWEGPKAFANALGKALGDIIDEKNTEYGPLFKKKTPAELIYEWLATLKGPVYAAYRGRAS